MTDLSLLFQPAIANVDEPIIPDKNDFFFLFNNTILISSGRKSASII